MRERFCAPRGVVGWSAALAAVALSAPIAGAVPVVVEATGTTAASITAARDQFRTDLGGGTTAGANGSFGGVRREINWDGTPAQFSAPNLLPADFFNVNSPRGAVFSTPGTGFEVSGATTDAGAGQPAAANFGNINASYTSGFAPFSAQRLFTPLGSTTTDVNFFQAGTTTPATVSGFGAVFSDVDLTGQTRIDFFDAGNALLFSRDVLATPGAGTFSFLGVSFTTERVSRVRITTGNLELGPNNVDNVSEDVVVMDDFIYSEPQAAAAIPLPAAPLMALAGAVPAGLLMSRWKRRGVF